MNKLIFTLLLLGLTVSCSTEAQMTYSTSDKKAIKCFEEALASPNNHYDPTTQTIDYTRGIELLNFALDRDPNFVEAHMLKADYLLACKKNNDAITELKTALEINPNYDRDFHTYYQLANLLFRVGKYSEALQYALEFQKNPRHSQQYEQKNELLIESCHFVLDSYKVAYTIQPMNMGSAINTFEPEYFPTLTVDGKTLLFTRRLKAPENPLGAQEDFFVSNLNENGRWEKAYPMPQNINTARNEGAPTLAPDGRSLIFVACPDITGRDYGENRYGKGSCDLFITRKTGTRWSSPHNLPGGVNTSNWETQPSLSSDGKTLYFIRGIYDADRNVQQDIYCAHLQPDETWSAAERLPGNINTNMKEESVFIHPDGKTLYFSSNGHPGYGGLDIFMTTLQPDGTWSNPLNLGAPINSPDDENSLLVGPDGEIAFFASDRPGGYGGLDLYYFEMPEQLRPIKTTYMDGIVFDKATQAPLPGHFQLIDLKTGKVIVESDADKVNGSFLLSLPTKQDYALNVSYPGYMFYSKNFTLTDPENDKPYHVDIPLQAIEINTSILLDNIFFDLGKYTLRPESQIELNKLVEFLNANPSIKIEIGGYTDTRGDAAANQLLSENRAKSVHDYLVSKSISGDRLTYKGYGETHPKISDDVINQMATEAEKEAAHQQNRRTEYKITAR